MHKYSPNYLLIYLPVALAQAFFKAAAQFMAEWFFVPRSTCAVEFWERCYWCGYWASPHPIPLNLFAVPRVSICPRVTFTEHGPELPLCDWCFDWHMGIGYYADHPEVVAAGDGWVGGPYEPTAISRAGDLMQRWFTCLPHPTPRTIAEFLVPWHAP